MTYKYYDIYKGLFIEYAAKVREWTAKAQYVVYCRKSRKLLPVIPVA